MALAFIYISRILHRKIADDTDIVYKASWILSVSILTIVTINLKFLGNRITNYSAYKVPCIVVDIIAASNTYFLLTLIPAGKYISIDYSGNDGFAKGENNRCISIN